MRSRVVVLSAEQKEKIDALRAEAVKAREVIKGIHQRIESEVLEAIVASQPPRPI